MEKGGPPTSNPQTAVFTGVKLPVIHNSNEIGSPNKRWCAAAKLAVITETENTTKPAVKTSSPLYFANPLLARFSSRRVKRAPTITEPILDRNEDKSARCWSGLHLFSSRRSRAVGSMFAILRLVRGGHLSGPTPPVHLHPGFACRGRAVFALILAPDRLPQYGTSRHITQADLVQRHLPLRVRRGQQTRAQPVQF